jgi:hypothetical protein
MYSYSNLLQFWDIFLIRIIIVEKKSEQLSDFFAHKLLIKTYIKGNVNLEKIFPVLSCQKNSVDFL